MCSHALLTKCHVHATNARVHDAQLIPLPTDKAEEALGASAASEKTLLFPSSMVDVKAGVSCCACICVCVCAVFVAPVPRGRSDL